MKFNLTFNMYICTHVNQKISAQTKMKLNYVCDAGGCMHVIKPNDAING